MSTSTNPQSDSSSNSTNLALKSKRERLTKRLILWSVFSLFMGTFPIILNLLVLIKDNKSVPLLNLFAHGELLLISVALISSSIAELVYSPNFRDTRSIIAFCLCFIILVISASWFASLGIGDEASNIQWFGIISLMLYITSSIISAWCQVLAVE